jgi:hypothetical protein
MRGTVGVVGCLILCCLLGSTTSAQVSMRSMSTRVATGNESDCQDFINNPKPIGEDFAARLPELVSCADALLQSTPNPGTTVTSKDAALQEFKSNYGDLSTPDEVDEQLIKNHFLSRILRRWANLNKDAASTVISDLDQLDAHLHTLMEYVGLLDPFAGSLVAGPVFGDSGKLSPNTTTTTGASSTAVSTGTKTDALAHIEWSSKHFGDESSSPIDFSFGGSFGLQPALTLLTTPPPATGTTPVSAITTSQYQSAFIWNLNAAGNVHTWSHAETSGLIRAGQVRLLSGNGATIVDQGTNSTLLIPVNGNTDRFAWFYEGGMEFNYYNKALEVVHAEKGQLNPLFNAGLFYEVDTRFKQSAGLVGFDSPDRRLVFHFMINGLKIFDRRPDTTSSKPWSISFGVQHERGFGTNPLPSGTEIIIRGDLELLKLISPGSAK